MRTKDIRVRPWSLLVTKGGEKATAMLVGLDGIRSHDPRSSTDVAFYSTNSTGNK